VGKNNKASEYRRGKKRGSGAGFLHEDHVGTKLSPMNTLPGSNLTELQQAFVSEYLIDMNITQAAIRAGYSAPGASVNGWALLRKPKIVQAIKEQIDARVKRLNKRFKELQISQDRILREIAIIAFSDPRGLFNSDGTLKPVDEWTREQAGAIQSIKVTELFDGEGKNKVQIGHLKEIKFWDKTKALELAAKHLGMLQTKLQIKEEKNITLTLELKQTIEQLKTLNLEKQELEQFVNILRRISTSAGATGSGTDAGRAVPGSFH